MENVTFSKARFLLLVVFMEILLIQIGCYAAPLNFKSSSGDGTKKHNLMGYLSKYVFNDESETQPENIPPPVPDVNNFNNETKGNQKIFPNERNVPMKKESGLKYIFNSLKSDKKEKVKEKVPPEKRSFFKSLKPVRDIFLPFLSQRKIEDGLREKQKQIINQMINERKQKYVNPNKTAEPDANIIDYTAQMEKNNVLNQMKKGVKPVGSDVSKLSPKFKCAKPSNFLNYPEYYYYPDQAPPSPKPGYYDEPSPSNLMFYDEEPPTDAPEADSRLTTPVQSETYRSKNEEIKTNIYY